MNPEPNRINQILLDALNQRSKMQYRFNISQTCLIFHEEDAGRSSIAGLFTESHDTLQKLIDVLEPEELDQMRKRLCRHWFEHHTDVPIETWLLKRPLPAFVAALVEVAGGEKS